MSTIQTDIEARLAASEPEVEVLLAEVLGGSTLRLFIDHPDGVTLGLCERVTHALADLRERYALEVSSPGIERPLRKPAHFAGVVGREVTVRTAYEIAGRKRFRGAVLAATARDVSVSAGGGAVPIPYEAIVRGNLTDEGQWDE